MPDPRPELVIVDYDPAWPGRFRDIANELRQTVGGDAVRVDHIGSTSVPGLAAKDLIDIQITVPRLDVGDAWADELLPGLVRRPGFADHVPAEGSQDPADWAKRYWSHPNRVHVHVREEGRPNQRYPLLFRDYLRADPLAARSYGAVKRELAAIIGDDWDAYCRAKDPVCDVVFAAAEQWAARVGWEPPPSDAWPQPS